MTILVNIKKRKCYFTLDIKNKKLYTTMAISNCLLLSTSENPRGLFAAFVSVWCVLAKLNDKPRNYS